jgi:hypothetical protein
MLTERGNKPQKCVRWRGSSAFDIVRPNLRTHSIFQLNCKRRPRIHTRGCHAAIAPPRDPDSLPGRCPEMLLPLPETALVPPPHSTHTRNDKKGRSGLGLSGGPQIEANGGATREITRTRFKFQPFHRKIRPFFRGFSAGRRWFWRGNAKARAQRGRPPSQKK